MAYSEAMFKNKFDKVLPCFIPFRIQKYFAYMAIGTSFYFNTFQSDLPNSMKIL